MRARRLIVGLIVMSLVVCFSSVGGAAKKPDLIFYMSFDNASGDEIKIDMQGMAPVQSSDKVSTTWGGIKL